MKPYCKKCGGMYNCSCPGPYWRLREAVGELLALFDAEDTQPKHLDRALDKIRHVYEETDREVYKP